MKILQSDLEHINGLRVIWSDPNPVFPSAKPLEKWRLGISSRIKLYCLATAQRYIPCTCILYMGFHWECFMKRFSFLFYFFLMFNQADLVNKDAHYNLSRGILTAYHCHCGLKFHSDSLQ